MLPTGYAYEPKGLTFLSQLWKHIFWFATYTASNACEKQLLLSLTVKHSFARQIGHLHLPGKVQYTNRNMFNIYCFWPSSCASTLLISNMRIVYCVQQTLWGSCPRVVQQLNSKGREQIVKIFPVASHIFVSTDIPPTYVFISSQLCISRTAMDKVR